MSMATDEATKMLVTVHGINEITWWNYWFSRICFCENSNKEQNRASNRHGDNLILVWRFSRKKKTKNYNLLFAVRRVSHHESRSCDIHILSLSSRHRLLRNLFYLIWRGKKLSWILASGHVMHQKHECRDRLPSSCALHWIFELHSMHALLIMIEQKKIRPPLTGLLLNEQFGSRIRSTVAADNASGPELNIFGVWVRLSGK